MPMHVISCQCNLKEVVYELVVHVSGQCLDGTHMKALELEQLTQ